MSSALPAWLNASLASPTSWGDLVGGPLAAALTAIEADEHVHPHLRQYVSARRSGKNQKQAAAALGVTTRTARNYQKRLRELLNEQGFSMSSPAD